MSFVTKEWKDRLAEFAGRRKLTNVSTGEETTVDVSRAEGEVSQAGDAFSAANMNDLEQRVADEFNNINTNLTYHIGFPDYNSVITEINTKNASYTATENCWVIGSITGDSSMSAGIIVDDVIVALAGNSSGSAGYTSIIPVPVKKGSIIKTRNAGTYALKIYSMQ